MFWSSTPVQLVPKAELLLVRFGAIPSNRSPSAARSCLELIAPYVRLVCRVAASTVQPHSLYLPALSCECRREIHGQFACVLHFDEPVLGVAFPKAELRRPNPNADEGLVSILSRYVEHRLSSQSQEMAERVRQHMLNASDSAEASAESVAAALGISIRTLHRRLNSEQTSYRKVVREFRIDRCREQLRLPTSSAKEIAFTLGFGSPASFHRAFRRWTGRTVGEYRRHQLLCDEEELSRLSSREK